MGFLGGCVLSGSVVQYGRGNTRFRSLLHEMEAQKATEKRKPFIPALRKLFLITGLGFLSWLATYSGMMELIQANAGEISFNYKVALGFAVAMLMLMIIYLLDSLFSTLRWWLRLTYVFGYVFLTLISVGFGFGFYWKFLQSHSEATRSANSAVENVQLALQSGQTRLEQLQMTFFTLRQISEDKAEMERTIGGTCPKSPPGDGPRRRLRESDARDFQFAEDFVRQRTRLVQNEISGLNRYIARSAPKGKAVTGLNRNGFHRELNQKLNLTLARFNALRSDPQLMQFRESFASRAKQTRFPNGKGRTFYCPDSQLKNALRGVVRAIDGLPNLEKTQIASVEGPDAILEAFRRLTVSAYGWLTFNPAPSPEQLRSLQQRAVNMIDRSSDHKAMLTMQSGLSPRDYIPLFLAIFVDLCLLLVSINRPVNRLQGFFQSAKQAQKMQMHNILKSFHDVHDSSRSQRLDIFHQAMFDAGREQYIAVPLDMRSKFEGAENEQEFAQAKAFQSESRYLANIMAALEDAGLAKRAYFIGSSTARSKLKKLNSPYSDVSNFRVYRFIKGAWPAIILDEVLGEAKQLSHEKALLPPLHVESLDDFELSSSENNKAAPLGLSAPEESVPENSSPKEEQPEIPKVSVAFTKRSSPIFEFSSLEQKIESLHGEKAEKQALPQEEEAQTDETAIGVHEEQDLIEAIKEAEVPESDRVKDIVEQNFNELKVNDYHHVVEPEIKEQTDMTDLYIEQIEKEMMQQDDQIFMRESVTQASVENIPMNSEKAKIQIDKIAKQFAAKTYEEEMENS